MLDQEILLAILLVDEKQNHEYFAHKYNISNNLKETLNLLTENVVKTKKDKQFLKRDLSKNIYFFGKRHTKQINLLNFCKDKKVKLKDYLEIEKIINKTEIPKFKFNGTFLKSQGLKEGTVIGETLKVIEKEWLNNNFNISNARVTEIIKNQKIKYI